MTPAADTPIPATVRAGWLLMRMAFRAGPVPAALALALSVLAASASASYGLALKLLVDAAAAAATDRMVTAVALLVALVSVNGVMGLLTAQLRLAVQHRVELLVDQDIVRISAGMPGLEHFETPTVMDRMELLRTDRAKIASAWGAMVENLRVLVRLTAVVALLATVNPWLLALGGLAVPSLWASAVANRWNRRAEETTAEPQRLRRSLFHAATTAASAKEARIYGLTGLLREQHRTLLRTVDRAYDGAAAKSTLAIAATRAAFTLGALAAIALTLRDAEAGRASAGDVALVMSLAGQFDSAVSGTAQLGRWLHEALRGATRYLWLTDYATRVTAAAPQEHRPGGSGPRGELVLDKVTFTYLGAERPVLREVSLRIPLGSTVAVIGDNGAGKTTLVKLLCRFYEPTSGRILVDGTDLRDIPVERWRERLSACFQDFARFEFTLHDSVGVGDLARGDDATAVLAALRRADAAEIPVALPHGLDTQLGSTFDGGTDLSGGQWQKLALARASMRHTPDLLLLDEPTASLDPDTEHSLIDAYTRAARGIGRVPTTVLISHRLSAVTMATTIVVMDAGRVIETGTHNELVAAGGSYAELYQMQASRYR